jgi:hypothetical protein
MPINTEDFKSLAGNVQYQSELPCSRDWQTTEPARSRSGERMDDMADDVSLAMRQFYQSPARTLG